ncbi:MAG: hypothetical protein GY870_01855 [archaeon]|nr:hypothetical protein [archaeon]
MTEKQVLDFEFYDQMNVIDFLKLFKKKSSNQYAILMETLIFRYFNWGNKKEIIKSIEKTANDFIKNTYLEIKEPDPKSWDDFFKVLNIPLNIDNLQVYSLQEKSGYFIVKLKMQYSYKIDDSNEEKMKLYDHLIKLGYSDYGRTIFENEKGEKKTGIRVGYEIEVSIPFTFEEQFFYLGKYFIFFNLFIMWRNICDYYRTVYQFGENKVWLLRDRKIPEIFNEVITDFFLFESNNFLKKSIWKYNLDSLNRDTINILYNKYLFSEIGKIEKKLSLYIINRIPLRKY